MYAKGHCWNWDGGHFRTADGTLKRSPGIREQAGIERRVRFHDLRHTCAANLVSGSWGRAWRIEEVRAFLGHSSITTTEIYAHLAPDALHATARATTARVPLRRVEPVTNLTGEDRAAAGNVSELPARPEGFEI
jgi:hypothetical protein